MKKPGIILVLFLLLAVAFASGARAEDRQLTIVNDSSAEVTVAVLWSGGGLDPAKLGPGERENVTVPSNLDSVKTTVTGKCREAHETFNPQRATRATVQCQDGSYKMVLAVTKPAS
jgi:hypothetical protein